MNTIARPFSLQDIRVIAFDADDTLWENEPFFRENERELYDLLAPYGSQPSIAEGLYQTEMDNMPDYGYGAVSFTMSLIEHAIRYSDGRIPACDIARIIESGRRLVRLPATPLEGVRETLEQLRKSQPYQMVIFTKGELLTQENKIKRSGLLPLFDRRFVVTNKAEENYRELCRELEIEPQQLIMVGNSLKSDILPAVNIGAYAIHIPYEVMWEHEMMDPFEHPNKIEIAHFRDLLKILLTGGE